MRIFFTLPTRVLRSVYLLNIEWCLFCAWHCWPTPHVAVPPHSVRTTLFAATKDTIRFFNIINDGHSIWSVTQSIGGTRKRNADRERNGKGMGGSDDVPFFNSLWFRGKVRDNRQRLIRMRWASAVNKINTSKRKLDTAVAVEKCIYSSCNVYPALVVVAKCNHICCPWHNRNHLLSEL